MPRLGSLTQAPRQMTRFGANLWPMAGQGFTRLAAVTGQELAPPPKLMANPWVDAIAHYHSAPWLLKRPTFTGTFQLAPGVTRNSSGVALGNCDVYLFINSARNEFVGQTVSDGSGNFAFTVSSNSDTYWLMAYEPGSPDVGGITVRGLVAV